jgi:8-oxo-dGTP pyrophosphatase MutT (NUDIX family)
VAAVAVYVNVNGKLLVLERAPDKSEPLTWGIPGGKLEADEETADGAIRELFEETGIDVVNEPSFESLGPLFIRKPEIEYTFHLFGVHLDKAPSVILSAEHVAYKWVAYQETYQLKLMQGARYVLDFYSRLGWS